MFAQHMLAVCKPGGMVTTVMPHGVLFRGGEEKEDPPEVPRTGPHRGHHRPAAEPLLRRRHPGLHPGDAPESHRPVAESQQARRTAAARCSSSMPTPSSTRAARRTTCGPSTSRRSSPPLTASRTCPATRGACRSRRSAVRPTTATSTSAATWTTRRRPSRTTCARICSAACLWPKCEAKRPLFDALGFDLTHAFAARTNDTAYFDFAPALADRSAIRRSWKMMPVCRPASRLYAMPWRHGGTPTQHVWPTCPHGATSTPYAPSFSIPSSPRSRR